MDIEKALDETESFLLEQRDHIPSSVHKFLVEICKSERDYVAMVKSFNNSKRILKVPEAKTAKYLKDAGRQ
jgi:hypothetical protein